MERCAFCGHQRISCACSVRHFYPSYRSPWEQEFPKDFLSQSKAERAEYARIPLAVYEHGLSLEQEEEWARVESARGRVPYIEYPNICRRCGALWPDLFVLPDAEWEKYVQISARDKRLCRGCFLQIKGYTDLVSRERGPQ